MLTTQQAADLQSAIKKALHSASFGKFMAQAVHTAFEEAQPASTSVILPAPRHTVTTEVVCDGLAINSTDGYGWSGWVQRCQDKDFGRSLWFGQETRTDQHGKRWQNATAYYITDDFGTLVEVAR